MIKIRIKTENILTYLIGYAQRSGIAAENFDNHWKVCRLLYEDYLGEDGAVVDLLRAVKYPSLEEAVKAGQAYIEKHGGTLA